MNRIAALMCRDGGPVHRAELEDLAATLAVGGGGATEVVLAGAVGVASRNGGGQSNSPAGATILERGGRLLVADARIDNGEQLARALDLGQGLSDVELILRSFERWGEDAANRLEGDFAIVLADVAKRTLVCARDGAGARPLLYSVSAGIVAVASEMRGLLGLPPVARELDEGAVRDFLLGTVGDPGLTLLSGVRRLPPGHILTVTPHEAKLRCFWRPEVGPELRLGSDEEYAEAFREVFFEAVRCRLRGPARVGTTLSGGLDSSSVTAVFRDLVASTGGPVPRAYSARFPEVPRCDEGRFIQAVGDMGGIACVPVRADVTGPFEVMARIRLEAPLAAPNVHLGAALFGAAREDGVTALLDGHDGDTAVSHGLEVLPELLRRGRILRFVFEARRLARNGHDRFASIVREHVVRSIAPRGIRRSIRMWTGQPDQERPWSLASLEPDFSKRTNAAERLEEWREHWAQPLGARADHARRLGGAFPPFVSEVFGRVGASHGVEARHPFYDRRLIDFCLSLPLEQRLQGGATRGILRTAMKGHLPEAVRTRPRKRHLTHQFVDALFRRERDRLQEFVSSGAGRLGAFLAPRTLEVSLQRFFERPTGEDALFLFSAYALALTLEDVDAPSI